MRGHADVIHRARTMLTLLVATGLLRVPAIGAQGPPRELSMLAVKAQLAGTISAWCRAEFRAGVAGSFAVAVQSPGNGGQYVALDSDGKAHQLALFIGKPDLSCYSRTEASRVNATIRQSDTVDGSVAPRWNTTVVCGFVDATSAVCWQYSPDDQAFVQVGGWTT